MYGLEQGVDQRDGALPALAGDPCPVSDERIVLMGLIVETNGHLSRALGSELERACGLPLTWFDVLIRLGRAAEKRLTMSQLAEGVLLTSGGITRLVDRMTEAGYVERQSCPSDRRSIYVALTDTGRAKMQEAVEVHLEGLDRHLVGPLDESERQELDRILRKLRGDGPICGS